MHRLGTARAGASDTPATESGANSHAINILNLHLGGDCDMEHGTACVPCCFGPTREDAWGCQLDFNGSVTCYQPCSPLLWSTCLHTIVALRIAPTPTVMPALHMPGSLGVPEVDPRIAENAALDSPPQPASASEQAPQGPPSTSPLPGPSVATSPASAPGTSGASPPAVPGSNGQAARSGGPPPAPASHPHPAAPQHLVRRSAPQQLCKPEAAVLSWGPYVSCALASPL